MGIPPSAGITGDAPPSSPLWKDTGPRGDGQRVRTESEALICLTPEFQYCPLSWRVTRMGVKEKAGAKEIIGKPAVSPSMSAPVQKQDPFYF